MLYLLTFLKIAEVAKHIIRTHICHRDGCVLHLTHCPLNFTNEKRFLKKKNEENDTSSFSIIQIPFTLSEGVSPPFLWTNARGNTGFCVLELELEKWPAFLHTNYCLNSQICPNGITPPSQFHTHKNKKKICSLAAADGAHGNLNWVRR